MRIERAFQTVVNPVTTAEMLEFRILGPLEVLDGGTPVPLGGRNQRALLTLLLLRANEAVSTERLVDQLWGEHPPRTATTSLQNTVSQLRKLLGPGLLHTRPTGLPARARRRPARPRPASSSSSARRVRPSRRSARMLLREALGALAGPAARRLGAGDFAPGRDPPARGPPPRRARGTDRGRPRARRRRRARRRAGGARPRASAARAAAGAADARALPLGPAGGGALSAYHDARRTLVDELGIEPGPELQALYGSILRQERSLVRVAPPALEDHYDEVMRALRGRPARPGARSRRRRRRRRRAGAPARRAVRARGGGSRPRVHLAGGRGAERDRARSTTSCISRSTGRSSRHRCTRGWPALPPLLRDRGLPQQLIVSTSFDTGVERAFEAAGEELDVVVYVASGRDRGKFLHIAPDGERPWCTSQMPTPASRSRSAARC